MAGISTLELFLQRWIGSFPEPLQIVGHLNRPAIGSKDLENDRNPAARHLRGVIHADQISDPGAAPGWLPRSPAHSHASPSRERKTGRSHLVDEPRIIPVKGRSKDLHDRLRPRQIGQPSAIPHDLRPHDSKILIIEGRQSSVGEPLRGPSGSLDERFDLFVPTWNHHLPHFYESKQLGGCGWSRPRSDRSLLRMEFDLIEVSELDLDHQSSLTIELVSTPLAKAATKPLHSDLFGNHRHHGQHGHSLTAVLEPSNLTRDHEPRGTHAGISVQNRMLATRHRTRSMVVIPAEGDSIGKSLDEGRNDRGWITITAHPTETLQIRVRPSSIGKGPGIDAPWMSPGAHHQTSPPREITFRVARECQRISVPRRDPARHIPLGKNCRDGSGKGTPSAVDRIHEKTADSRRQWKESQSTSDLGESAL